MFHPLTSSPCSRAMLKPHFFVVVSGGEAHLSPSVQAPTAVVSTSISHPSPQIKLPLPSLMSVVHNFFFNDTQMRQAAGPAVSALVGSFVQTSTLSSFHQCRWGPLRPHRYTAHQVSRSTAKIHRLPNSHCEWEGLRAQGAV